MPITQPPLSSLIHAALRAEILAGEYPPGSALPSERALSERLGTNRHAVREALKRLQQAGLVQISQGGATRVRDWRRTGGLELLVELAASGEAPPGIELPRATLEMRASVGADAARLCARRAGAAIRAELVARAAALTEAEDLDERNEIYERLWDVIVDTSENVAYRLALNTLLAGQRVLRFDAALVADELAATDLIRALVAAIADRDEDTAERRARNLLNRSIPKES
ncbi:MAG TPA: GntR family transcriptional regulator [Solirubrobacteraceae bacterium]|nr:GntR family transcriptional regulator [Solirubrobacteraceae bacterium]